MIASTLGAINPAPPLAALLLAKDGAGSLDDAAAAIAAEAAVNALLAGAGSTASDAAFSAFDAPPSSPPPCRPAGCRILASTVRSAAALQALLGIVGGVQLRLGLDGVSELAFLASLKSALTAMCGSTWHLVLGCADGELRLDRAAALSARKQGVSTAAAIMYDAHAPAFAVAAAEGCFLELSLAPLASPAEILDSSPLGGCDLADVAATATAKAEAAAAARAKTPARYTLCMYRSAPGQGEPRLEALTARAAVARLLLPGWDGRLHSLPRSLRRNGAHVLRTLLFAAAAGCLCGYATLLFWHDNACSRVLAPALPPVLGLADVDGSGAAGAATMVANSPFTGAVARRLAIGPLPRLVSDPDPRVAVTLGASVRDVLTQVATAFNVPWADVGASSSVEYGGSLLDAYLDSLLPPVQPVRETQPHHWEAGDEDEEEDFGRSGLRFGDAFLAAQGLPPQCKRRDIVLADRRALRARALVSSAAVFVLLASLVRVLAGTVGRARRRPTRGTM